MKFSQLHTLFLLLFLPTSLCWAVTPSAIGKECEIMLNEAAADTSGFDITQLSASDQSTLMESIAGKNASPEDKQKAVNHLYSELDRLDIPEEIAALVIEGFNDLKIVNQLLKNPMVPFAVSRNSVLSPFALSSQPEDKVGQIMDRIDKLNAQESWTNLAAKAEALVTLLNSIQAADDKRTTELGYELVMNLDLILQGYSSKENQNDRNLGKDNKDVIFNRAMSLLGQTFEIVEKSYYEVTNGQHALWQLDQELKKAEDKNSLLARISTRKVRSLKFKINKNLIRLGRHYGRYKTARFYLEDLASEANMACNQECKAIVNRLLGALGITRSDVLKDPTLFDGQRPSMADISLLFNSNRWAKASYLTFSVFLQTLDVAKTGFYTLLNPPFLLDIVNRIQPAFLRKLIKKAFKMGMYMRAKRFHFLTLKYISDQGTLDQKLDQLIRAEEEKPGILETASRLRHFPWDEIKTFVAQKAQGNVNKEQFALFFKAMEEAEVQGREYGFITFDAKLPLVQFATLLGASEYLAYHFAGVHLHTILTNGVADAFNYVSVVASEHPVKAAAAAAASITLPPIFQKIKNALGKAKSLLKTAGELKEAAIDVKDAAGEVKDEAENLINNNSDKKE